MEQKTLQSDLMQASCRSQLSNISDISSLDLTPPAHLDDGLRSAYTTRLSYMRNSSLSEVQEPVGERERSGKESLSNKALSMTEQYLDPETRGFTTNDNDGIDLRVLDISGAQAVSGDPQRASLVGNGSASTSLGDALSPDFSGLSLGSVSSHTLDESTPRPSLVRSC